MMVMFKQR